MALPSDNGIFIHKGLNCSPNYVPTAQSIPISTSDNTTVKSITDTTLSNIAEDYDATSTYAVGDCVLYQRVLYQCTTAIPTAEAWNSDHWTAVKAVDVGSGGGSSTASQVSYDNTESGLNADNVQDAIDEVVDEKADRVPEPAEYSSSSTYAVGDFCTHSGSIYCCTYPISSSESWNSDHWALCIPQQDYLHSINPKGYGSFSLNRKMNTIIGPYSSTEGYNATASGYTSHAEGAGTVASGGSSHAEGYSTTASGENSHTEGNDTKASAYCSHAEGQHTTASGTQSHAEGLYTTASGNYSSHAEGYATTASGWASHAEGYYTTANHYAQHVFGECNVIDPSTATALNRGNYIEIVGNGTSTSARSNARTLDWSGNEVLAGTLTASGLVLTGSITDAVLTSPRCEIASIQQSKCYQIGNIIFYSAEITFSSTITQAGAVYFLHNKVTQSDFCWGSLFYDTGDTIYKVAKGYAQNMWVTNGTTRTQCSDVAGKSRMFLNLTIVKA